MASTMPAGPPPAIATRVRTLFVVDPNPVLREQWSGGKIEQIGGR
jgi:hypothetical protein